MKHTLFAPSLAILLLVFCVSFLIYSAVYAMPGYSYKCHTVGHRQTICEDIDGSPCYPGDQLCQCHDEYYWTCENGYSAGNTACTGCQADADL